MEFGDGFALAGLQGSQANDPFRMQGGRVVTTQNRNGGVNAGITNGMPVVLRTVVKPTPSIYKSAATVDYAAKRNATLQINSRHDPLHVHRPVWCQDSLVASVWRTCARSSSARLAEGSSWNTD